MKHKNLEILKQSGFNVPDFWIFHKKEEYTPVMSFILGNNITYAVRSSSFLEDGHTHSFAGQFTTLLNIEKQNLGNAIADVFDSMYATERKYQSSNDGTESAVIVQKMINADMSGVLFTANPDGILNETVIVIGNGLGNNIVEDKTDVTTYYYNQDDKLFYYEQQNNSPLLTDDLLQELISVSTNIHKIFGKPVDIEFCIENNILYILQARPITTLTNNHIVLDNSNIVESYPGISLPLTQSFVKEIYHEIFYSCVQRATDNKILTQKLDNKLVDMVDIANWRIYYRINNWYSVLALMPFSNKIISIWQDMLGVDNKTFDKEKYRYPFSIKIKTFFSMLHYLRNTPKYMDNLNQKFEENYPIYLSEIEKATTIGELLQTYTNIKYDILTDWDITLFNDMYTFIYTALSGKKNRLLLKNMKNLGSMRPVIALRALHVIYKSFGLEHENFNDALNEYIESYGDRCLGELKLETKTYRTHPELLIDYLKKTDEITTGNIINDLVCKKDNYFVKKAKLGIQNREISRLNRSKIYGISRSIFRKIGKILYENGKIETIDDVFYLYISELDNFHVDLIQLIKERKEYEKQMQNMPAYSRLVYDGYIFDKQSHDLSLHIVSNGNTICGVSTSGGVVEGDVLVVDKPSETLDSKNKILVTVSTDPGWVFLIQNSKGIIAEKGSLLSHTAIISRELNKPSIVNVKDATKILKTGDKVRLDANSGTITILKEEG